MTSQPGENTFSRYQIFIVAVLSFIQFTVVLDFMVIAPLGAMLLNILNITTSQFGWVVSAYAFSAGISGLLAAGFADKFDRKHLLLFFYGGFMIGTLLCGIATDFHFLLIARIITGLFGGVMASMSMAIVTDLFPLGMRSRVMGYVQMSFAVSQVAGIPLGIYLANSYGWHAPFFFIVAMSVVAGAAIVKWMRPIDAHLHAGAGTNAFLHLKKTISQRHYVKAFGTTALLSIGAFMLMPFSSAFIVNNVGVSQEQLPLVFMFTGAATLVVLPVVGRISDEFGKLKVFIGGSIIASVMILIYTQLSITPLWLVVIINIVLFAGIMSRAIPAMALMTAIPDMKDRGAFMSINSSLQQISGGIASVFAGTVVVQINGGSLMHYDTLGFYCVGTIILCVLMMFSINTMVEQKIKTAA
jgi:predicted MFS family arabinose efflux permease